MKTTFLRLALVVLALLMTLSVIACTVEDPNKPPVNNNQNQGNQGGETVTPPETQQIPHSIPDGTFFSGEGNTFHVLHYTVEGAEELYNPWDEIAPSTGMDSTPGDTVGDMIFARNAWIEEKYGIVITNEYMSYSKILNTLEQAASVNDATYQMVAAFQHIASAMMGKDLFLNMADIEYIDFDDPWWVDSAIEELSLGEYVEFSVSDLLLLDKGATALMYYNKDMAEDLGIDDLYELARGGQWTMATMAEYAALALDDDGDDEWTPEDVYGLVTGDDPVLFLYASGGHKFIDKDEDGDYFYSYCSDDTTANAMISILEDVMYADWCWNFVRENAGGNVFTTDKSLFDFNMAKGALRMREMKSAFGVLPVPKLYDDQEQYHSLVSGYNDCVMAIPLPNYDKTELIGAAIELMSYYSYYNIQEPFYETILQLRGTRDEESMEMLDIVFSSRTYDLGYLYDPAGVIDPVLRYNSMTHPYETAVISFWEESASKREEAIRALNELRDIYNDK